MALFNPKLSQGPSGFNPIVEPRDPTVPNAIKTIGNVVGSFAEASAEKAEAQAEQESAQAFGNLFASDLRSEATAIQGQEALETNQSRIDALYQDGTISPEEQSELGTLMQERQRIENVTDPRRRQVMLRTKYANFVNRFPHLTKEARVMFGDSDSRLEQVASGAQGLVDEEAFKEIYGQETTAENIAKFRNLQKFKAQRQVGSVYGEANFQDFSNALRAEVTTGLYSIGQRMNALINRQGFARQEDIDSFHTQLQDGYIEAVQGIDASVLQLQNSGQYVNPASVSKMKEELKSVRDDMMKMSNEKDFNTRLGQLTESMDLMFRHQMDVNVGALGKLFAGEGSGGARSSADIATLRQLLDVDNAAIQAAENLPAPYGDGVRMMRQGAVEYINFLNEYDARAVRQYIAPNMARELASMQWRRIDNGAAKEDPAQVETAIDLMEQGGTSDESAEGLLERPKTVNESAIKNNQVKSRLSSFVNNYALETETFLKGINGRIRQTENGPEVVISQAGGRMVRSGEGTRKLRNLRGLYDQMDSVGDLTVYESLLDKYASERNTELQEVIQELSEAVQNPDGTVNTQLVSHNVRQLKIQYGLTDEEVARISSQIRSGNGSEVSGSRD